MNITLRNGVVAGLVVCLAFVGACGDDDDDDTSAMCEAKDDLDDNIDKLENVDLADTSINDVTSDLDDLKTSLSDLNSAAKDDLKPQVDDMTSSLEALQSAITDLGSSGSLSDAGTAIMESLEQVQTAAEALKTAAKDACDK